MGKASQRKGRRNELALGKLLTDLGHKVRVHTQWEAWDLSVDDKPVEVKCRANGFGLYYDLADEGIETVYVRADRKPWLKLTIEKLDDPLRLRPDKGDKGDEGV